MGTDKKNRAQRDDKESIGSVENGSGNKSSDPSASLAARRAKLRGALGGRSSYATDPFGSPPAAGFPDPAYEEAGYQSDPNYQTDPNYQAATDPSGANYQSAQPQAEESNPIFADSSQASAFPANAQFNSQGTQDEGAVNVYGVPIDQAPEIIPPPVEAPLRAPRTRRATASHSTAGLVEAGQKPTSEPEPQMAAAASSIEAPAAVSATPLPTQDPSTTIFPTPAPVAAIPPQSSAAPISSSASSMMAPLTALPEATTELINSIDQSLNVCATNLAALQNIAGEQTDVLKGLSSTLQNQTLLEIGLNLNSLTESLTAALEPMKAIGELVPALDALVTTLESKEQEQSEKLSPDTLVTSLADQLSAGVIDPWTFKCAYMAVYPTDHPADLLHRLVELLGTQRLSGDLFRAAYEAVQAAEPPPRAAYAATTGGGEGASFTRSISDEAIKAQLESLERSNREMQARQEERERELSEILSQKENELQIAQAQLNDKLEEINNRYADAADMIASREEEFRAALESKDMDLIEKDAELNMLRAQMEELRSQTEEMVKDLQKEMQRMREDSIQPPPQEAKPNAQGFFDAIPPGNQRQDTLFEAAPSKPVFASDPAARSGFDSGNFNAAAENNYASPDTGFNPNQQQAAFQAPAQAPQPAFQQPAPAQAFQAPQAQQAAAPTVASPAAARPAQQPSGGPTTNFGGQSGSYGMGVRQQVFEVIVRQALAGAPWREICAGPMQVNNISPDEVEAEVKRRQSMLNK